MNENPSNVTSKERSTWQRFKKLVEEGCRSCEFDEAEGGLFCHCKKCQLTITTLAYELVCEFKGHMSFPDETAALPESLRDPLKVMERGRELLKQWEKPLDCTCPYESRLTSMIINPSCPVHSPVKASVNEPPYSFPALDHKPKLIK